MKHSEEPVTIKKVTEPLYNIPGISLGYVCSQLLNLVAKLQRAGTIFVWATWVNPVAIGYITVKWKSSFVFVIRFSLEDIIDML